MKNKKQQIINAAILLFSEQGYKATTMRQIAKKVGITAGSLYNHVKSKENLLVEIQTKFMDDLVKKIKEYQPNASAEEKLKNAIEVIIETISLNKLAWKILIDEYHHFPDAQKKKILVKGDEFENSIKKIIEEGKTKKEFENVDTKFATFFLLGACHHSSKWINPKGELPAKEIGRRFSSFLLHGLCKRNQ